jgi:CBS domain-containing protein
MSPRAAWRLESLRFTDVYDYVGGKAEWAAAGLPVEGRAATATRLGQLARSDVLTCGLAETVATVRSRLGDDEAAAVVNDERVVLGLVRAVDLGDDGERPVAEVMREGPSTYRPNLTAAETAPRLEGKKVARVVVTTSDGRLVGIADPDHIRDAAGT